MSMPARIVNCQDFGGHKHRGGKVDLSHVVFQITKLIMQWLDIRAEHHINVQQLDLMTVCALNTVFLYFMNNNFFIGLAK